MLSQHQFIPQQEHLKQKVEQLLLVKVQMVMVVFQVIHQSLQEEKKNLNWYQNTNQQMQVVEH